MYLVFSITRSNHNFMISSFAIKVGKHIKQSLSKMYANIVRYIHLLNNILICIQNIFNGLTCTRGHHFREVKYIGVLRGFLIFFYGCFLLLL